LFELENTTWDTLFEVVPALTLTEATPAVAVKVPPLRPKDILPAFAKESWVRLLDVVPALKFTGALTVTVLPFKPNVALLELEKTILYALLYPH
jgi:hypothetical protein